MQDFGVYVFLFLLLLGFDIFHDRVIAIALARGLLGAVLVLLFLLIPFHIIQFFQSRHDGWLGRTTLEVDSFANKVIQFNSSRSIYVSPWEERARRSGTVEKNN